jgi:pimeloyl-ACP methyl ester carboxylesterase
MQGTGLANARHCHAFAVLLAIAGFASLLSSCAPLPGEQEVVSVGGGAVEITQSRASDPPVVFENGLTAHKEEWSKVFPEIARTNTVFAYNRPGIGESPPTDHPRDGATIVEELRALLPRRNIRPPYVLVGHSAGGLYMQLFARRYPEEVAGLVLVDSTHPEQFVGEGAMENRSALANAVISVGLSASSKAEFRALVETGREVLAAPPLSAKVPAVILIAPDTSGSAMSDFGNAKRHDFARLYPGAAVLEAGSSHNVPQDNPQAVIDAIRKVLAARAAHPAPGIRPDPHNRH